MALRGRRKSAFCRRRRPRSAIVQLDLTPFATKPSFGPLPVKSLTKRQTRPDDPTWFRLTIVLGKRVLGKLLLPRSGVAISRVVPTEEDYCPRKRVVKAGPQQVPDFEDTDFKDTASQRHGAAWGARRRSLAVVTSEAPQRRVPGSRQRVR